MEKDTKFIAFNTNGINHADEIVSLLLRKSITYMNDIANISPNDYKKMSGNDIELFAYHSMVEVAPSVSFPTEKIDLVSGHIFPDILLHETKYGVEIKSTQKDAWTSTGSSIIESTRNTDTERVYLLFGKLGGIPEFRCKPYQQCLSNIAVTHSPRYLIDMNLKEKDNIFSKMQTDYEDFRTLGEAEKISYVREYYIKKARAENKYEMPWWMGESTNINLSFYNDLPTSEKNILQVKACILFKSLYEEDTKNRYRPISLWLCNNYSLLCPNIRDEFSAGGKCTIINGERLTNPYPHIVKELLRCHEQIKYILRNPDEDIIRGIHDFWDFAFDEDNYYNSWLNMVEECFKLNPTLSFIPIRELLDSDAKPF